MTRAQDGGFVLGGYTSSFGSGNHDLYVVKTDGSGALEWSVVCGGQSGDECYGISTCPNGAFIAAGNTWSFGPGVPDWCNIYVVRFTANGDTVWTRVFGGDRDDFANGVCATSDGGGIVTGMTRSYGTSTFHFDMYLLKITANGDSEWMQTYGGAQTNEEGWGVLSLACGGYVAAGSTTGGSGSSDVYVVRTDSLGTATWITQFSIDQGDYPRAIHVVPGGFVIAGSAAPDTLSRASKMFLARLDDNGDTLWTKLYSGNGFDLECYDMQVTMDGGYILAGVTYDPFPFPAWSNSYLIRTDSAGNELWRGEYGQYYEDEGHAVAALDDGSYVIAGSVHTLGAAWDDYLVRTERDPALVIRDRAVHAPSAIQLSAYPNPFNSATVFSFSLPHTANVELKVYDVTGRLVQTLSQAKLPAGEHEIKLDAGAWPSGIYFARMQAGAVSKTVKIALIR